MQVRFANRQYRFPSEKLGELRESNDILHDAQALRQRMAEDGYLFLRRLIDPETVLAARQAILHYMAEHEGIEPGSRPLDGVMGQYGKSVGMLGRRAITDHPAVEAALESPQLFDLYSRFFDEPALTFDYKWLRAVGHEQFTGAHYDVVYMGRGSQRLHTCWIPLGELDLPMGVLAICEGSHRQAGFEKLRQTYGRMDVDRDRTEGSFSRDPQEITDRFGGQWKTASFRPGDVLTFGMYTMHASTTNMTDRWRLSCDVRFQPASEPADPRWMGDKPPAHTSMADSQPIRPIAQARAEWGI